MYSFKSRVRYSEIDYEKKMDICSIINYFQDCSIFHSEDVGMGLAYLEKNKRVWLLNAWQIIVDRYPLLGEEITVSTWAYDFKGMYGYRNFSIRNSKGEIDAYANSVWVYLDTDTYHPVKVTDDVGQAYHLDQKIDMDYAPRKIPIPKDLKTMPQFSVTRSTIDTNNHVNNGQYIKMAQECLPDGYIIRQMRAEYRMSAVLGDIIVPMVNQTDDTYTVVLANKDGNPYTIIEFKQ